MRAAELINEGGNAIPDSNPVRREDIAGVIATTKKLLPKPLLANLQTDIGSAGYKAESGDIDVMVEAGDVVSLFKTQSAKDPVAAAKKELEAYFKSKDIQAKTNGRNVSIGVPYPGGLAQVDVMVIHDTGIVAPYHQHGPRGMYSDSGFRGSEIFILVSSLAKFQNLKFDAFGAKLVNRDTNEVVARTRDQVAKVLLNPRATGDDLNSIKSILAALKNDPDREGKLAQAQADAGRGLLKLSEDLQNKSPELPELLAEFLPIAMEVLELPGLPEIILERHIETHDGQATFGRYVSGEHAIHLAIADRHPVDILRTLAHELTHFKQDLLQQLNHSSGETGSPEENQAHVKAGIIMRLFGEKYPDALNLKPITLNS